MSHQSTREIMTEPTDTLYLVGIGNGIDLLISKDEILVNNYCESTEEFDCFVRTAHVVASHFGGEVKERSLPENLHSVVDEMFEALPEWNSCDKHIAEFIMEESFVKEFEGSGK